ncbi:two-component system sensor histidine kinase DcuS [Bacillus sp. MUM 116]|uniref:DcuS/MalK family sensor histidine kinase n=1 Tax=Bacillus sp. MUM 116 TaxID=1678002 RepID=UPI0008F5BFBA|nr:DcuS/MalK family sensor histidine kinase [Bacillus sp. MUM 116]OIK10551.1 two-component system sensor histidine kinase DcuS [Bacillus sp. MUM 116]
MEGLVYKRLSKPKIHLQTVITLMVCFVVVLAFLVTDVLISYRISNQTEKNQADKATHIAKIVAQTPLVIDGLKGIVDEKEIQRFASQIRKSTQVEFIVVMDMNGIRKSHPNKTEIGKHFVGGDEQDVLKGQEHVSIAKGTMGVSLRSFIPVYDEKHKQVGAVAVGISLEKVNQAVEQSRNIILIGTVFGILVGIIGALFLARKIKKILFGLEPSEIAKILEERSTMLQSTREGMLAVDQEGRITLVNNEAIRLFHKAGIQDSPIGRKIDGYLPNSRLTSVLKSGDPHYDQEQDLGGATIITNRVPIIVKGKIVGAIATFREKTEIKQLAEQLTGVKLYAEALRTQSHEFMNKLHVISGLIHMKNFERVSSYITDLVDHQQTEVNFVVSRFKDPVLAGFLLGKLSYARENGSELTIDGEGIIPEPLRQETTHELVTILGNLIDNALDALKDSMIKSVNFRFDYYEGQLVFEIHDTGKGIPESAVDQLFIKGYSTNGQDRGIGLYLVKQSIESLNGTIEVISTEGKGTTFIVFMPYQSKE